MNILVADSVHIFNFLYQADLNSYNLPVLCKRLCVPFFYLYLEFITAPFLYLHSHVSLSFFHKNLKKNIVT